MQKSGRQSHRRSDSFHRRSSARNLARVFECLQPDCTTLTSTWRDNSCSCDLKQLMADQASFHRLKLVSPKFRKVFAEHPELSAAIIISNATSNRVVPSALTWIQRWRESVCTFMAFSKGQPQQVLLGALACENTRLQNVFLTNPPTAAVCALSVFTSLQ